MACLFNASFQHVLTLKYAWLVLEWSGSHPHPAITLSHLGKNPRPQVSRRAWLRDF